MGVLWRLEAMFVLCRAWTGQRGSVRESVRKFFAPAFVMEMESAWEDLPCIVLLDILARLGPEHLGNSFLVCKQWSSFSQVEILWFNTLCREHKLLHPILPPRFETWREYSRYLRKQSFHVLMIGLDNPSTLRLENETGSRTEARGVMEIKLTNIRVWVESNLKSRHVFMCLMASQELLMWYVDSFIEPFNIVEGMQSYSAPFKQGNAVVGFALEACGALVLTQDGSLYDTVSWNMGKLKGRFASFERVRFESPASVISYAISSAGVKTAVLESGLVYVWGTVCQSLVDYIGKDAFRIFGLNPDTQQMKHKPSSCISITTPCQVLPDPSTDVEADFVEVTAGKVHFLARSKNGNVWTWGVSGRPKDSADSVVAHPPNLIHTNAAKLCSGSILQNRGGKLYAFQEFVCGDELSLWTPMYNLQNGDREPAAPNPWPWRDGKFGALQMGSREIDETGNRSETQLYPGYTRYSKHGTGCIRIHIYSDNNCQTYGHPLQVLPMFDVGPDVQFSSQGNMYFGSRGQIVVKDVKQSMSRDQFFLMDLRQVGIEGKVVSIQKACGGLLVAAVTPL